IRRRLENGPLELDGDELGRLLALGRERPRPPPQRVHREGVPLRALTRRQPAPPPATHQHCPLRPAPSNTPHVGLLRAQGDAGRASDAQLTSWPYGYAISPSALSTCHRRLHRRSREVRARRGSSRPREARPERDIRRWPTREPE